MTPMFPRETFFTPNNKPITRSLFYELHTSANHNVVFTLKAEDHLGYLSLRKLYLSMVPDDPTEVTFAETVFGDYGYWEILSNSADIKEHVDTWRRIADVKRKSEAFAVIVKEVKNNSNFHAAKYLVEEPWKKGKKARAESRSSTEEAFGSFKDDVSRMKQEGLLN